MKNIIKYILITATRDWFFLGLLIAIISTFGLSSLIGTTALSEQLTMQIVIFAGTSRIILVCGIIIFICFNINKSFENKEVSFMLSKNISREKFILSYWVGFNIISLILLLPIAIILFLLKSNLYGAIQWLISINLELMMITTFAILASLILKSAVFAVLSSFGFYLISRLVGFFIKTAFEGGSGEISFRFYDINQSILRCVSSLIPRLDLFGQTKWIVYGADINIMKIIFVQSIIYIIVMFLMAFYDFKKKQF